MPDTCAALPCFSTSDLIIFFIFLRLTIELLLFLYALANHYWSSLWFSNKQHYLSLCAGRGFETYDSCWHSNHQCWCCFYYFQKNSSVALLKALFPRVLLNLMSGCANFLFMCVHVYVLGLGLWPKACLGPTRLLLHRLLLYKYTLAILLYCLAVVRMTGLYAPALEKLFGRKRSVPLARQKA